MKGYVSEVVGVNAACVQRIVYYLFCLRFLAYLCSPKIAPAIPRKRDIQRCGRAGGILFNFFKFLWQQKIKAMS